MEDLEAAGAGLEVIVVLEVVVSVLGLAAGTTVSSFFSHAASSAAPARMQMILFIVVELGAQYRVVAKREQHPFLRLPDCVRQNGS